MSLDAGRLRHRVAIQERVQDQDSDTGDIVESWLTLATVWAAVEPLSGREFLAAAATQSLVTAKIIIRKRTVDATMRVVHRGTIYNVAAVLADKDSGLEYLTLMCSEGPNVG